MEQGRWEFTGTFDDFQLPQHLSLLIKWIFIGPNKEMSGDRRERNVEKDISLITQLFMLTIKSNRQANYQPYQLYKNESYITRETPLSVRLGLDIYQKTRSKTLLDVLSGLLLIVPYEKICSIKNDLVTHTKKKLFENGGIYYLRHYHLTQACVLLLTMLTFK